MSALRAPVESRPAHVYPGAAYRWTAAGIIAFGSIASILSSTAVNVAVPTLQRVFGASLTDIQWISTGYLLGLAAVIPVSGWVSDRFGTKRTYVATLATFILASLLCGFAGSTQTEVAFRVVQGLAGGMVMPVGMTMLMQVTPPQARGRMMGIIGVPMLLAPAFGPAVSGWILQSLSWQYIFWINIPFCAVALVLAAILLRDSIHVDPGRLDVVGVLLCTPGVTLVIYGVTRATDSGWGSPAALVPVLLGLLVSAAFVAWERRQERPLLELGVLRDAAFAGAATMQVVLAAGLFGALFIVPVFMQQVQGYGTLEAGTVIAAQGIGSAVAMPVAGWLTDRIGARPVVFTGIALLTAVSFVLATVGPSTTHFEWWILLGLRGVAVGSSMMPAFSAAYVSIRPDLISRATALANTVQRLASSMGIAAIATITTDRVAAALPHGRVAPAALQAAVSHGFDQGLVFTAGLVALALPASLLLRRPLTGGAHRHAPLGRGLRVALGLLSAFAVAVLALSLLLTFG